MSKYLQESYDASLKEIEELKIKLEIAKEALDKIVSIFHDQGTWASIEFDGLTYSLSEEDYEKYVIAMRSLEHLQR